MIRFTPLAIFSALALAGCAPQQSPVAQQGRTLSAIGDDYLIGMQSFQRPGSGWRVPINEHAEPGCPTHPTSNCSYENGLMTIRFHDNRVYSKEYDLTRLTADQLATLGLPHDRADRPAYMATLRTMAGEDATCATQGEAQSYCQSSCAECSVIKSPVLFFIYFDAAGRAVKFKVNDPQAF